MPTWGEIAREDLHKRGLIYFSDLVDEVRTIPRPDVRGVLAVASAHCLARMQVTRSAADGLDLECAAAVDSMWALLIAPARSGANDWAWLARLREHVQGEDEDRDLVAATLYAAEALASNDPNAAAWAVSRLIDDRFASLNEDAETIESATPSAQINGFIRECAAPELQRLLRLFRSSADTLLESGVTSRAVVKIREAFDAG